MVKPSYETMQIVRVEVVSLENWNWNLDYIKLVGCPFTNTHTHKQTSICKTHRQPTYIYCVLTGLLIGAHALGAWFVDGANSSPCRNCARCIVRQEKISEIMALFMGTCSGCPRPLCRTVRFSFWPGFLTKLFSRTSPPISKKRQIVQKTTNNSSTITTAQHKCKYGMWFDWGGNTRRWRRPRILNSVWQHKWFYYTHALMF